MSAVQGPDIHAEHFNENSPRPPVPGEETERVGTHSPTQTFSYTSTWGVLLKTIKGGGSPVLTPRRSSLLAGFTAASLAESNAPLGFEPEGSSEGGDASSHREVRDACVRDACVRDRYHETCSTPPYMHWAENLYRLLNDSDGVELFRRYLEQESQTHADALNFWFACKGLKTHSDPDKVTQLVKVIYRRFLLRPQIAISDDLRKDVTRQIKEGRVPHPQTVFDGVQNEVETLMNKTTYPSFLKSEIYLQYVRQQSQERGVESGSSTVSTSSCSSRELLSGTSGLVLQTVPEDAELPSSHSGHTAQSDAAVRLTRDTLMATVDRRATELRPKPEKYAGMYLQRPFNSPYLTQPTQFYNSYNPVSRQDSELQSLSSDARTDCDNVSLTDRSLDGMSTSGKSYPSRRQHVRNSKIKEYASMNHDPHMHQTFIPRTQRMQMEQPHPMQPEQFAAILTEKLQNFLREKDAQEKLDRKLIKAGSESELHEDSTRADSAGPSRSIANTFRKELGVEDDSDQAILDQHVSRVWSDLTPSRSPGLDSPRPKSPLSKRRVLAGQAGLVAAKLHAGGQSGGPYLRSGHSRHARKDKDVFSTFSSDSGNVHDFPDMLEHKHHVPKSKSVPDADALWQGRRASSSKKSATEQTDSGVSVLSDTPPVVPTPQYKESTKVLQWLKETAKDQPSAGSSSWHSQTERDSKHRLRMSSTTSPSTSRHSRKQGVGHHSGSRSGSQERCLGGVGATAGPAQPFVTDPMMPLLPQPHIPTQLEEARRRLDEELTVKKRHGLGVKAELPVSNQATFRRPNRAPQARIPGGAAGPSAGGSASVPAGAPPPGPSDQGSLAPATIVVFSFCDEQVPYRTKIPARPVTLKQFKEILPKKGTYRYFFKTECEEVETKVIQEEITDDNEELPLWEGKVMAQVKPVE